MKPEFENVTFGEANEIIKALDAALDAMAHFSGHHGDEMDTLGSLLIAAKIKSAEEFRKVEEARRKEKAS